MHQQLTLIHTMSSTESHARTSTNPPNDLKVVIIGGGVCGLVCLVALKKFGIEAHLYEGAVRRLFQILCRSRH